MKHVFSWLQAKLSRSKSDDPPSESDSTDSDELDPPIALQVLVSDAPQPESVDFELDVIVPDFKPDDQSSSDAKETTGFDPYNTAKTYKK